MESGEGRLGRISFSVGQLFSSQVGFDSSEVFLLFSENLSCRVDVANSSLRFMPHCSIDGTLHTYTYIIFHVELMWLIAVSGSCHITELMERYTPIYIYTLEGKENNDS